MAVAQLTAIVKHCDNVLSTARFNDYDGALNGLQVANRGKVTRIGAAVDANLGTVKRAIAAKVNLLLVHHGLFWSGAQPYTGNRYELMRLLIEYDIAVYSSHLPLDAHPKFGNNAQLCTRLGLKRLKPFFEQRGSQIGFKASTKIQRVALVQRLRQLTGSTPVVFGFGPAICRRIGVVTGSAGAEVRRAAAAGLDTFITGEGPHWTFTVAEELGINLIYAGHYATETFGVKALAAHLSRRFGLAWTFLDNPSGL